MPSFEEELAAYRAQLASIASGVNPQMSAGAMGANALNFNSLLRDMAQASSIATTTNQGPVAGISPSVQMLQSATPMNTPGFSASGLALGAAQFQSMVNQAMAYRAGSIGPAAASVATPIAIGMGPDPMLIPAATSGLGGGIGAPAMAQERPGIGALVMGEFRSQAAARTGFIDTLRAQSWRFTGGMGFGRGARRDIASNMVRDAISDPDLDLRDFQTILERGGQLGMFSTTQGVQDFKQKFRDLKENLKSIMTTMQVSAEEGLELMADLRQGGFYTPGAQRGAVAASMGLGRGAGFTTREMHEVGLVGAAQFRGTGMSTSMGFQLAQQNLAAVTSMQRQGLISDEIVNQMGGRVGAARTLTRAAGTFMQSGLGQGVAAALMNQQGRLNRAALADFLAGTPIEEIMSRGDYNPAVVNPYSIQRTFEEMGPTQVRAVQARLLQQEAGRARQAYPELTQRGAIEKVARPFLTQMGVTDTGAQQAIIEMAQNTTQLVREARSEIQMGRREMARADVRREGRFWEVSGLGGVERRVRGWFQDYVGDPYNTVRDRITDTMADIRMWYEGEERAPIIDEYTRAAAIRGGRRAGAVLSRIRSTRAVSRQLRDVTEGMRGDYGGGTFGTYTGGTRTERALDWARERANAVSAGRAELAIESAEAYRQAAKMKELPEERVAAVSEALSQHYIPALKSIGMTSREFTELAGKGTDLTRAERGRLMEATYAIAKRSGGKITQTEVARELFTNDTLVEASESLLSGKVWEKEELDKATGRMAESLTRKLGISATAADAKGTLLGGIFEGDRDKAKKEISEWLGTSGGQAMHVFKNAHKWNSHKLEAALNGARLKDGKPMSKKTKNAIVDAWVNSKKQLFRNFMDEKTDVGGEVATFEDILAAKEQAIILEEIAPTAEALGQRIGGETGKFMRTLGKEESLTRIGHSLISRWRADKGFRTQLMEAGEEGQAMAASLRRGEAAIKVFTTTGWETPEGRRLKEEKLKELGYGQRTIEAMISRFDQGENMSIVAGEAAWTELAAERKEERRQSRIASERMTVRTMAQRDPIQAQVLGNLYKLTHTTEGLLKEVQKLSAKNAKKGQ